MKTLETVSVSRVYNALVCKHAAGARLFVERRPSYAISFSLGGEIEYSHNGEVFSYGKNSVLIHPMGARYDFTCTRSGAFGVINFYTTHFFTDKFIKITLDELRPFVSRFNELREAFFDGAGHHRVMRIIYEILEMLVGARTESASPVLGAAVRTVMERYTDKGFGVSQLSAAVHVSESYLRRLFSEAYGISPKKYLHRARIERAKRLLSSGGAAVGDIAEACGFSGVYHFCRAFKDAVGETPTEYRATHRVGTGI